MDNNKKKLSILHEVGINIDEKIKYVIPFDEFDINFLQVNYNKFKIRRDDNVVPVWSLQRNKFDSNYYEFEIVARSNDNSESEGINIPVDEMTNAASIDSKNKTNIVRKLNTSGELIDFTTYMKLVNVFNKSGSVRAEITSDQESLIDYVVRNEGTSIKIDHKETAKNIDVNNDQLVTLYVLSGEKLKVSMSNFHGIWKSDDSIQCRVCMVMVEDVEAHKMDIQHMKGIASTINNKHCIRKIGPIWNHCILCNEIVENIEFHLKVNTAHTNYLERALKSSTSYQPIADVCSMSVDTVKNTNINQSTNNSNQNVGKSTIKKLESHIKKPGPTVVATNKNSVVNNETDLISSHKNESFCNICNRKMFRHQLKSHMEGKSHKALLLKLNNESGKRDAINCNLPNSIGEKNTRLEKPKENSVPENVKVLKDINSVLTSNECEAFCNICNRKMQSCQLESHRKGNSHKAQLLKIKNEGKKVAINCDLPSGIEIKNIRSNKSHPKPNSLCDKTEIQNLKIQKDKEVTNLEANVTGKKHLVNDNKKSVLTSDQHENVAYCKVCNIKLHINSLKSHEEGKHHKAMLNNKTKNKESAEDTIVKSDSKCEIGTTVTSESFNSSLQKNFRRNLSNCNGDRYDDILLNSLMETSSKLKSSTSSTRCINQQKLDGNVMKEVNTNSTAYDKPKTISDTIKFEKLNYLFELTKSFVTCKVCRALFLNDGNSLLKILHVDSEGHIKKYTYLLNQNTIKLESETLLTCEACKVSMYVGTELLHIKTEHHKQEVVKAISSEFTDKRLIYCNICDSIMYLCIDNINEYYLEKCCSAAILSKHCVVILDSDRLYCRYCSKYLQRSALMSHILSPTHILFTAQIYHRPSYTICYQMKPYIQGSLFCLICKEMLIGESVYIVLLHLEQHRSKYIKLLIDNKIEENGDDMFFCRPCEAYIELRNEIDHINNDYHRGMLAKSNGLTSIQIFGLLGCIILSLFYFYK